MSSSDPTDPLQAALTENQLLRARVADIERLLQRARADSPGRDASLEAREAMLSEAERISHMGCWAWDVQSNSVYWSDELFRICDYDPRQTVPSTEAFFARVHPEDRERTHESYSRVLTSGAGEHLHCRLLHTNGAVRYVIATSTMLFDASGNPTRAVGTILDVTEAREAARATERIADLLSQSQRIARTGSFEYELPSARQFWSEELYRILDIDPATPPSIEAFLKRLHDGDRARIEALVSRSLSDGRVEPSRARVVRQDGSVRYVDMTAATLRTPSGDVAMIRGIVQDVSEFVELEAQFHQSQKMEAIGQLSSGLAHDYNNLLTVIVGNTEQLLAAGESQELRDILTAAEAASEITGRLLTFARIDSGTSTVLLLEHEVLRLKSLLQRAVGTQVELHFEFSASPAPVRVVGAQVQQILLNLCLNARDAMPEGGSVRVSTRTESLPALRATSRGVEAGAYIILAVSDTGVGMDDSTQKRVFEPFFTTKAGGRGTGLGLSMVFGAMRRADGFIQLHSKLGQGTTFELWFPRSVALPSEHRVTPSQEQLPRGRAVLVDDDSAVLRVAGRMLEKLGYSVRLAAGAPDALAACREEPVDLLVTDVDMPGMSGLELAKQARDLYPALPVLFITGHSYERIAVGHSARQAVLGKPFRVSDLQQALDDLLAPGEPSRCPIVQRTSGTH
jgi:PAS domain S-box-containing protein